MTRHSSLSLHCSSPAEICLRMHRLHQLLQRLADGGIDFVVVGGYAGVLHGSSYVTNDLDVCAVLSEANVEKLRAALGDWEPVHRMTHTIYRDAFDRVAASAKRTEVSHLGGARRSRCSRPAQRSGPTSPRKARAQSLSRITTSSPTRTVPDFVSCTRLRPKFTSVGSPASRRKVARVFSGSLPVRSPVC